MVLAKSRHKLFVLSQKLYSRKSLIIIVSCAVSTLITFSLSHFMLQHSEKNGLNRYSNSILQNIQYKKDDIGQILSKPIVSIDNLCSDDDITFLREYLWSHKYIKDVGRIVNDDVACTAGWGKLTTPVQLPTPTKSWPSGSKHWRNVNDMFRDNVRVNLLAYKNTIVVLAPTSYEQNLLKPPHTDLAIATADGQYVFQVVGDLSSNELMEKVKSTNFHQLAIHTCLKDNSICVWAFKKKSGLWAQSDFFLGFLSVIAVLISGGLFQLLNTIYNTRNSMQSRLKRALLHKSLFVVFQPKVNLQDERITGIEALVRWQDEHFGTVPPDEFVTVAEQYQLMPLLSRLVIEKSLQEAGELLKNDSSLHLSINLSMADLSDESLLEFIDLQRSQQGIAKHRLIFEITERSAVGFDQIEQSVDRFVSHGYRISLDDFGTGYANLSWLSKIKAAEIKVDKIFTQSIGKNTTNQNMLSAIFKLVENLELQTVFEGIESKEQADYIVSQNKNAIGQGWLFAKPMKIEELQQFIKTKTSYSESQQKQDDFALT
ncbi:EAL domain-containing protein [Marinomonas mediterranea]|uniref:cyclic-guanylate-specific phosphodiesterase n=1 Tax=Marinomonas mediterranea (strain ATCC 700492 / JCM 21426 / NBRC 103028 / MMB-1) TaxID=717774 RepID=F2JUG9_MARM1|nr:EAL domain-containing protein [Marinomonas mediterranea]ADZ92788.1 EAL domain protein [Marinomonas mediterranea MMB-1]WCN18813.1 EAL domain-containing protein [Marinomonas mediterranea MMB-1]